MRDVKQRRELRKNPADIGKGLLKEMDGVNALVKKNSLHDASEFGFLLTVRNHFRKLQSAEKGGGPDMIDDKCTVCEVAET